jgi:hypothetical protein
MAPFGESGHVCFCFLSLFWIGFWEIQKLDGPKSEKLRSAWKGAPSFSLLGPSSFLDLPKADKNDEKLETNIPSSCRLREELVSPLQLATQVMYDVEVVPNVKHMHVVEEEVSLS